MNMHVESPEVESVLASKETTVKFLVLHNDDHNTFDFVIETLIEVCDHDIIQAEQCAQIVHYKGKCDVKKGSFETLRPMYKELLNRGLTATID